MSSRRRKDKSTDGVESSQVSDQNTPVNSGESDVNNEDGKKTSKSGARKGGVSGEPSESAVAKSQDPMKAPTQGKFYSHDDRDDGLNVAGPRGRKPGKNKAAEPEKWTHDLFETLGDTEKPKSRRGKGGERKNESCGSGYSAASGPPANAGVWKPPPRTENSSKPTNTGLKGKDRGLGGRDSGQQKGPPELSRVSDGRRGGVLASSSAACENRSELNKKGQSADARKGQGQHIDKCDVPPAATDKIEEVSGEGKAHTVRYRNDHDDRDGSHRGRRGGGGGNKGKIKDKEGRGVDSDDRGSDSSEKWQHNKFDPRGPRSGDARKERLGEGGRSSAPTGAPPRTAQDRKLSSTTKPFVPSPTHPSAGIGSGTVGGGSGMVPIPSTASYMQRRMANPPSGPFFDQPDDATGPSVGASTVSAGDSQAPTQSQAPVGSSSPAESLARAPGPVSNSQPLPPQGPSGYPGYPITAPQGQQQYTMYPPQPQPQFMPYPAQYPGPRSPQNGGGSMQQSPPHHQGHGYTAQQQSRQGYPGDYQQVAPHRGGSQGGSNSGGNWGSGQGQGQGSWGSQTDSDVSAYQNQGQSQTQSQSQQQNLSASAQSYRPVYGAPNTAGKTNQPPANVTYMVSEGTISQYQRFNEQQQMMNSTK